MLSHCFGEVSCDNVSALHNLKTWTLFVIVVKIDAFAEKNNMTEAVNVGKQFLRGISHKERVIGAQNETGSMEVVVPSHPLVEKLQNIKVENPEFYLSFHTPLLSQFSGHSVETFPVSALC